MFARLFAVLGIVFTLTFAPVPPSVSFVSTAVAQNTGGGDCEPGLVGPAAPCYINGRYVGKVGPVLGRGATFGSRDTYGGRGHHGGGVMTGPPVYLGKGCAQFINGVPTGLYRPGRC